MCAANTNMISKVLELVELRKMADELAAEMEAITDEIKAYMGEDEMARDEARHGKAFEGLLERYFGK